ncbi:MAG: NUDIX domain-containing protein [Rhodothermales bacterium]|nr:NUDIX domain-containing protein [Rhodothermales bacterium]
MFSRDTILRQIQQLVQVLARVLFHKSMHAYDEARREIDEALRDLLGLDAGGLDALHRIALLARCRELGGWSGEKALALADLLNERGQLVLLERGEAGRAEAQRWLQHAHALYAEVLRNPDTALPHDIHDRLDALRAELVLAATTLADIDWNVWRPVDPATLLFVVQDGKVLLIRKKRGLGAGKINGPGGRLEFGEAPHEGAIREVQEELLVTPTTLEKGGELRFQFVDGYSIHVHVFRAGGLIGEPTETDEAVPLWTDMDAIPYEEMWEDDRIWMPYLLSGRPFQGRFLFDQERMLDWRID